MDTPLVPDPSGCRFPEQRRHRRLESLYGVQRSAGNRRSRQLDFRAGFQQSLCLQQKRPEHSDLQQDGFPERLRYPAHRLQQDCQAAAHPLQQCQHRPDEHPELERAESAGLLFCHHHGRQDHQRYLYVWQIRLSMLWTGHHQAQYGGWGNQRYVSTGIQGELVRNQG